jgi:hypothetical protein
MGKTDRCQRRWDSEALESLNAERLNVEKWGGKDWAELGIRTGAKQTRNRVARK